MIPDVTPNDELEILLVGGGPSARLFYSRLDSRPSNVSVFTTGPAFRIYRNLGFIPEYWALMDSKVVLGLDIEISRAILNNEMARTVFLPLEAVEKSKPLQDAVAKTKSNVLLANHSQTGTFALRKCVDLSASRIFLIGLEGKYVEKIPESSRASIQKHLKLRGLPFLRGLRMVTEFPVFNSNYWSDNYQQVGDLYSLPRSTGHRDSLQQQIDLARSLGIEILNLSPISSLRAPFFLMTDFLQDQVADHNFSEPPSLKES